MLDLRSESFSGYRAKKTGKDTFYQLVVVKPFKPNWSIWIILLLFEMCSYYWQKKSNTCKRYGYCFFLQFYVNHHDSDSCFWHNLPLLSLCKPHAVKGTKIKTGLKISIIWHTLSGSITWTIKAEDDQVSWCIWTFWTYDTWHRDYPGKNTPPQWFTVCQRSQRHHDYNKTLDYLD